MTLAEANRLLKPGSQDAVAKGCRCDQLANCHGLGWRRIEGHYAIRQDCPLHGESKDERAK